jgi:hypothetical protein
VGELVQRTTNLHDALPPFGGFWTAPFCLLACAQFHERQPTFRYADSLDEPCARHPHNIVARSEVIKGKVFTIIVIRMDGRLFITPVGFRFAIKLGSSAR